MNAKFYSSSILSACPSFKPFFLKWPNPLSIHLLLVILHTFLFTLFVNCGGWASVKKVLKHWFLAGKKLDRRILIGSASNPGKSVLRVRSRSTPKIAFKKQDQKVTFKSIEQSQNQLLIWEKKKFPNNFCQIIFFNSAFSGLWSITISKASGDKPV